MIKKKINSDISLKNMLVVADRLKITFSELLNMPEEEFNLWLGFLSIEQDHHESEMRKARHK